MSFGSGSRCAVPGCPWYGRKAKSVGVQRSFFIIRRPDLAKNQVERKHRQSLHDFILRLRGHDEQDTIRMQLWKESAMICDCHFHMSDLILLLGRQFPKLRVGAVPFHNVEKTRDIYSVILNCERLKIKPKLYHSRRFEIWKSVDKLSAQAKGNWVFYEKEDVLVMELNQPTEIVPEIRLKFDEQGWMCHASFYGWAVPVDQLCITSLRIRPLDEFLRDYERIKICEGLSTLQLGCVLHPIPEWRGDRVATKQIFRSARCFTIAAYRQGSAICCVECAKCEAPPESNGDPTTVNGTAQAVAKACQPTYTCSAIGCSKTSRNDDCSRSDSDGSSDEESALKRTVPRYFHPFPRDPATRSLWLSQMRRTNWQPGLSDRICSDHFQEFHIIRKSNSGKISRSGLPSRFKVMNGGGIDKVCCAYGCNKRFSGTMKERSDSEGSSDEESEEKRKHPRSFHRFPAEPMMKRLWVRNIGRGGWYPTDRSRICSDHFKERDIYRGSTYVSLRLCAVPVRFKRKAVVSRPLEEDKQIPGTEMESVEITVFSLPSEKPQETECSPHDTSADNAPDEERSPHRTSPKNTQDAECSGEITADQREHCEAISRDHTYAYPACTETSRKKHSSLAIRLHSVRKSLRAAKAQNVELKRTCRRLKKAINEYCSAESDTPEECAARQMLTD